MLVLCGLVGTSALSAEPLPRPPDAVKPHVIEVPAPPPAAAHRGPDRTIDVVALDQIAEAAFSRDGRTLWLLGQAQDWDDDGRDKTSWPRLVGLDVASGIISHDAEFPLRRGSWKLKELAVTDGAVWASGTIREPFPLPPPEDPRKKIETNPDLPRFFQDSERPALWGFVVHCPAEGAAEPTFWFTSDAGYGEAFQTMKQTAEGDRLWQVETVGESRERPLNYLVRRLADGVSRLQVRSAYPATLRFSDDERYLSVWFSADAADGTVWRYDTAAQTWGWPRQIRRRKLNPPLAVSPDGRAAAVVGVENRSNRIDLYLFDDAERYDAELASRMAEVLTPPPSSSTPPLAMDTVTLPDLETPLGHGPGAAFNLADLGQPLDLQLEPDGSRAYVVHRLTTGSAQPAPTEDRIRGIDLATGETLWNTASPFRWERRMNNNSSTSLIVDPYYLIFVYTHPTRRGGMEPDPIAHMYRQTQVVVLRKDTGARVGGPLTTALHDAAFFSPVAIVPPDQPPAGRGSPPRSDRLVMVYHSEPWTFRYGQLDLRRHHWRIERWELPHLRRRVLMRSDDPGLLDTAYRTYQPQISSFALDRDGRTVTGWWRYAGAGDRGDHCFADSAVLRFDAETGRRFGALPLPPLDDERFLRAYIPGGLWRVDQTDNQGHELWKISETRATAVRRIETNGWQEEWWPLTQPYSAALWWKSQNPKRTGLLRLNPWSGRIDGPRAVEPRGDQLGDDQRWAYAKDGSKAVMLLWARPNGGGKPAATLQRYDFPAVASE